MDGYLNFWAINPHVCKGQLLAQVIDYNKEEMIDKGPGVE
jgi:hypothetical protein